MRYALVIMLALAAGSCARNGAGESSSDAQPAAGAGHSASHHNITRPEHLQWRPATALPPGAQIAVLEGDPEAKGFFAMRVRLPDGFRVPPHYHPCAERVTVLSGQLNLGRGDTFDTGASQALTTGSYTSMPAGMRHYAWATGATEIQIATMGPWGITYVNPADDPRAGKSR